MAVVVVVVVMVGACWPWPVGNCFFRRSLSGRVEAAWKSLRERNVVLEDTEEGYAAQLGDSVRENMLLIRLTVQVLILFFRKFFNKHYLVQQV